MHNRISILKFKPIRHTAVLACADVSYAGLVLRGLKLERRAGKLQIGCPGRKVGDEWQVLVQFEDRTLKDQLLHVLIERLRERAA